MKRRTLTAGLSLAVVIGTSLVGLTTQASAAPTPTGDPQARAVAAADRAATSGRDAFAKGPDETYRRDMVTPWINGLYSVSYQRTYRGLPVIGGDAVTLVDSQGQVRDSLAATTTRINVATTPQVSATQATATSRQELTTVDSVDSQRLLVHIKNDVARLAWETVLTGTRDKAPSHLHVYVDARSGAVLDSKDDVVFGTGTSEWNGPNPLSIDTQLSAGTYSLRDPGRPNLSCSDYSTGAVFSGPDDVWGNGDASSKETGCVDAMWAAQKEWNMLSSWLGRNGHNGSGGSWPTRVGLNQQNAFWDGSRVTIGRNSVNEWIASMDVVGHEYGHGIDQTTPSGSSASELREFVSDIFGALTEAYTNEPTQYDEPDYLVGETVNLVGSGPIRNMYNPAALGDPNCYSSSVPGMETHAAAGPGNHWFYLLAEGSNPTNGMPTSPTCNSSTVSGVGVVTAGKIFYGGMLLKTTSMTYLRFRTATLTAAKNLDTTCNLFNRTKAAWDAVSVPAQAGDPTCTGGGNDFSIAVNPTSGSTAPGGSLTATVSTTTTSGSPQTVNLSASGAPAGTTVSFSPSSVTSGGSSTMTVNVGTSTAAGTYTITVTGTGSVTRTAPYTLTVTGTGGCASPGNKVSNGGFESGTAPWTVTAGVIDNSTSPYPARTGSWKAWFNGYGTTHTDTASQSVTIPAGCTSYTLAFYLRINSSETTTTIAYDRFTVQLGTATLATYSNLNENTSYTLRSFNVAGYAGQTLTLKFTGTEDASLQTSFVVDDVSLQVS